MNESSYENVLLNMGSAKDEHETHEIRKKKKTYLRAYGRLQVQNLDHPPFAVNGIRRSQESASRFLGLRERTSPVFFQKGVL